MRTAAGRLGSAIQAARQLTIEIEVVLAQAVEKAVDVAGERLCQLFDGG